MHRHCYEHAQYSLSSVDKTAHSKKNLLDRLQGSFDTAIDFLVYHGVDQSRYAQSRDDLFVRFKPPHLRNLIHYPLFTTALMN